jgi:hypothetical protein
VVRASTFSPLALVADAELACGAEHGEEGGGMTKAAIERELAEAKMKLAQINAIASTAQRVAIITHGELLKCMEEIRQLSTDRKAAA